jgi:hypothetical protein
MKLLNVNVHIAQNIKFGKMMRVKGSDEKYYRYMMVEFADFKATRL